MYWLIVIILAVGLMPVMVLPVYSEDGDNRIHEQVQEKLSAGEKPNRLIKEKSPYLLQHAFNPIEWYSWGEEPFARAKKENKPIFLSIGYSTCHWCHVMAHESFENPEIAAILNKWFISIKVDREERPDIDQMYMAATQAMTGSGGWPMSVFLLSDGSPFYAGTYFPPVSSFQRPGFGELLTTIHTAWQDQQENLRDSASRMVAALNRRNTSSTVSIEPDVSARGYELLAESYDAVEGGFGKAPKFPRPVVLSFLFSHYLSSGEEKGRDMALFTLEKMAEGGMYDQIGGGFHRYSVDERWFVPHFEKMLYDQAQLLSSYLDAFQITQEDKYKDTAKDTFAYILRDMRDSAGGFYTAEDADSDNPYNPGEHGEGAFYLWTKKDLNKKLKSRAADIFNYSYGAKRDGNVMHDPMKEFTGRNILYRAHTVEEAATHFNASPEQIIKDLSSSREVLITARAARKRPHLDDKVISAWNGMMIGALAKGSRVLQDPSLLAAAVETASFLRQTLYDQTNHTLLRRYRRQEAGITGQLDDYTFLVNGLLELYQASQDPQWLIWSIDLTERQIALFWNETGNFFFDSVADSSIKVRMRDQYDGAEPTGNSVAAHNLLRLALLHNKPLWQQMARQLMESFGDIINRYPPALPLMLAAWQQIDEKPSQVVIVGERGAEDTEALLQTVNKNFDPNRLLLLADGAENQAYLSRTLPFLEAVGRINGKATAYVCSNFTCKMPVTDTLALQDQLKEQKSVN